MDTDNTGDAKNEEKQCRICFDGPEDGRLIRPCQCKGSIAYIHVECLQRWRKESQAAWYKCPQCNYKYRTSRTSVFGMAENPVVIASLSLLLFTCLAYIASFSVTLLIGTGTSETSRSEIYWGYNWDPSELAYNLMRVLFRILREEDIVVDKLINSNVRPVPNEAIAPQSLGIFASFFRRIIIGVPVLGIISVVQLLWSMPLLGPINFFTRRMGRDRRDSSRDIATIIVLGVIVLGALRALRSVYRLTERAVRWGLSKTEDLILEV